MKTVLVTFICLTIAIASCKKDDTINNSTTSPVGDWARFSNGATTHIVLKTDQTYEYGYDDAATGLFTQTITGSYTNTTNQFTLISAVGANACDTIKGTYGYTILTDTFTVATISDGCLSNGVNRSVSMEGKWGK